MENSSSPGVDQNLSKVLAGVSLDSTLLMVMLSFIFWS